ncbi:hypothetical protein F4804DRAFT_161684 [Jackrogersella minutella]|nr:hypothetical protein F4804DRAFT_161684 [Jackrogersella minutella]
MRAIRTALYLTLASQGSLGAPAQARQEASCAELSGSTPNWQITNAASSDWPGGASGRVELFARHAPTGVLADCDVEYVLDADGKIVDYDPAAVVVCTNFAETTLNTTVTLDMDTLLLNLSSTWSCEGDEKTYAATGSTELKRDTSPGACRVDPSQVGDATTCPIADVEVEGTLVES